MSTVTVYGKPDCHLCEDATMTLRALIDELGFELIEVDITSDDEIHRAYFERIPVITLDGEELFDYFVDEEILRRKLALGGGDPPEGVMRSSIL